MGEQFVTVYRHPSPSNAPPQPHLKQAQGRQSIDERARVASNLALHLNVYSFRVKLFPQRAITLIHFPHSLRWLCISSAGINIITRTDGLQSNNIRPANVEYEKDPPSIVVRQHTNCYQKSSVEFARLTYSCKYNI